MVSERNEPTDNQKVSERNESKLYEENFFHYSVYRQDQQASQRSIRNQHSHIRYEDIITQ